MILLAIARSIGGCVHGAIARLIGGSPILSNDRMIARLIGGCLHGAIAGVIRWVILG